MARHRRHRRYHGITSVSLGALPDVFSGSVSVMDAGLGVVAGLATAALVRGVVKKFAPDIYAKVANVADVAMPAVTGLAAAAVLYYAQGGSARAKGHAVGATLAGLSLAVAAGLPKIAGNIPYLDFSDVVSVNLNGYGAYRGLLVNDRSDQLNGFNGLIVADKSDALNELAAMSMGDGEDEMDIMSLGAM